MIVCWFSGLSAVWWQQFVYEELIKCYSKLLRHSAIYGEIERKWQHYYEVGYDYRQLEVTVSVVSELDDRHVGQDVDQSGDRQWNLDHQEDSDHNYQHISCWIRISHFLRFAGLLVFEQNLSLLLRSLSNKQINQKLINKKVLCLLK